MNIISNHIIECIALVTAIWNYKHIAKTRYVYFVPFLAFMLLGELGVAYFAAPPNESIFKNNHINLLISIVEFIFVGYQFHEMFRSKMMKGFTLYITSLIILSHLLLLFFFTDISALLSKIWGITGFFLCCISSLYLYEVIIHSNRQEEPLLQNPNIWFSVGLLIFWVSCTIPFVIYTFLSKNQVKIFDIPLYNLFPQIFSVVLYSCFTVAILLWRRKNLLMK